MRRRSIDPTFWISESIGTLPFEVRLFFVGLWAAADREGRLEDRPARLRALIFPYDPGFDAETAVDRLEEGDMVRRYTVDGQACIAIVNFRKYQQVHHKEAPSELPPLPKDMPAPRKRQARPKQEVNTEPRKDEKQIVEAALEHYVALASVKPPERAPAVPPPAGIVLPPSPLPREPKKAAPAIAWDINELRKYSGTRAWDAYYRTMDKAYGQNQKWPSFRQWMLDNKEDPDAGTAPQS